MSVPGVALLPALKVDPLDPAANAILSTGGRADPNQLAMAFASAAKKFPDSSEAPLRLALVQIGQEQYAKAEQTLHGVAERDPFDWRVHWYRGRLRLGQGQMKDAYALFDRVYSELPGELAPKLACALAAEAAGNRDTAMRLYDVVSRTDPSFTAAAFGLARCRAAVGDRAGAVAALARVPATSSLYVPAQLALARALVSPTPTPPSRNDLMQASQAIQALGLDGLALHQFSAELFLTAVAQVEAKAFAENSDDQILGQSLHLRSLRAGAERELRACAHLSKTPEERVAFVGPSQPCAAPDACSEGVTGSIKRISRDGFNSRHLPKRGERTSRAGAADVRHRTVFPGALSFGAGRRVSPPRLPPADHKPVRLAA